MDNFGLVHIYCGDGKGKTTAAMGLALRACSIGAKVLVVQFLKNGKSPEVVSLKEKFGVTVLAYDDICGFSKWFDQAQREVCTDVHNCNLKTVFSMKNDFDMIVLDEIIGTIHSKLINESLIMELLKNKPEHLEIVMTGRDPSEELMAYADYISEIKKIKHPYDQGIKARVGIEK